LRRFFAGMKAEGVSFRHAAELLWTDMPVTVASPAEETSTVRKLPPPGTEVRRLPVAHAVPERKNA
jgi:hypothetical protein